MRLESPPDAVRWRSFEITDSASSLKSNLEKNDAQLADDFIGGRAIEELLSIRAWFIERAVLSLWVATVGELSDVALIATGGFGRGELHPHSDVDLLILVGEGQNQKRDDQIQVFFAQLWDVGLTIGHAVRRVIECEALARSDVGIATGLMESRFIEGAEVLYLLLLKNLLPHEQWDAAAYAAAKHEEKRVRHLRFHDTAYNLEPNIKEGPGGLRDLQTVLWIAQRQTGACTFEQLYEQGLLSKQEFDVLLDARQALWRIRFGLHRIAKRAEERLLFEYQRELARLFGLIDEHAQNLAVEQFMQYFYRAVMTVERMCDRVWQRLAELRTPLQKRMLINDQFESTDGYLKLINADYLKTAPSAIMDVFTIWIETPDVRGLHASLLTQLDEAMNEFKAELAHDVGSKTKFLILLKHPGAVAEIIQQMNRCGVLGLLLPAFGKVCGRMQYDLFHAYTVDQHTLFILRFIRSFANLDAQQKFPLASVIYSRLHKPELLLLAGLFHDIAKGRGGDHSELGAEEVQSFCQNVTLPEQDVSLVVWLVRHHLLMSVTAQKKDLSDPLVIRQFADQVESVERLDFLYLLTVADICATSTKLWNSWKDRLLIDLYQATHQMLTVGKQENAQRDARVQWSRMAIEQKMTESGADIQVVRDALEKFPEDAFLRYSEDQLAWQTQVILTKKTASVNVAVRVSVEKGTTELFVYCADRDGLFATITAVLDRLQFNVVEARIMTSLDGYSLDMFQLLDLHGQLVDDEERIQALIRRLNSELTKQDWQLMPARRALSSRQRQFSVPVSMAFERLAHARTQLSLVCVDRPGLLAHIAAAFRTCGVRVHAARIATFGERAEDFFELSNQNNQCLDASSIKAVGAVLLRQIESL